MKTGEIEANLVSLNQEYRLPYINDLVERKLSAGEHQNLPDADLEFHRQEYERLVVQLETQSQSSQLPETPTAQAALDDLLKRLRLHGITYRSPDARN